MRGRRVAGYSGNKIKYLTSQTPFSCGGGLQRHALGHGDNSLGRLRNSVAVGLGYLVMNAGRFRERGDGARRVSWQKRRPFQDYFFPPQNFTDTGPFHLAGLVKGPGIRTLWETKTQGNDCVCLRSDTISHSHPGRRPNLSKKKTLRFLAKIISSKSPNF